VLMHAFLGRSTKRQLPLHITPEYYQVICAS
jgi:hypothetical protein